MIKNHILPNLRKGSLGNVMLLTIVRTILYRSCLGLTPNFVIMWGKVRNSLRAWTVLILVD